MPQSVMTATTTTVTRPRHWHAPIFIIEEDEAAPLVIVGNLRQDKLRGEAGAIAHTQRVECDLYHLV